MQEITVKGFAKLFFLFKERGWENPMQYKFEEPMTAEDLCRALDIPREDVEVVFINNLIHPLSATLKDGDRVAFVPPGIPSVHRFWLGFYDSKEDAAAQKDE